LGIGGRSRPTLRTLIASLAANHVLTLNKFWRISVALLIPCNLLICMDNRRAFCVFDDDTDTNPAVCKPRLALQGTGEYAA
jgi:hypothetical protein